LKLTLDWSDPHNSLDNEELWTATLKSENASVSSEPSPGCTEKIVIWDELEKASRHLEVAADNGYPLDPFTTPEDMQIPQAIVHHIQGWFSGSESQLMWLCGSANPRRRSEVSMAAAYVVTICERLKIPLLAYRFRADEFGIPEAGKSRPGPATVVRSIQMNRLILMTQSIIRQLVWILPDRTEVEKSVDLSFKRFYDLDASTESLLDMLNLVEELLRLLSPKQLLVCVLDGFQLVDNDTLDGTASYLAELLHIIRKSEREAVRKVLLSSDGLCYTLLDEEVVSIEEQIHVSEHLAEYQILEDEIWKVSEMEN